MVHLHIVYFVENFTHKKRGEIFLKKLTVVYILKDLYFVENKK